MPIVYCLIKMYDKKEYADDLLKGRLYFNTIEHHRKKGNDPLDGIMRREILADKNVTVSVDVEVNLIKYSPVYCMTAIHSGDFDSVTNENREAFGQQVMLNPELQKAYGNHAVVISDFREFKRRAWQKARDLEFGHHWIQYRSVKDQIDNSKVNRDMLFCKRGEFSYENEYRFAVYRPEDKGHFELDVGDLSDIAFYYKTEELNRDFHYISNGGSVDSVQVQVKKRSNRQTPAN